MENVLQYLLETLENPSPDYRVGRRLVEEQLRKFKEASQPNSRESFGLAFVFKKGDVIPHQFRGISSLEVDDHGVLINGWQDSWHHLHDGWPRDWPNNSTGDFDPGAIANKYPETGVRFDVLPQARVLDRSKFSARELEVLKELGILS